LKSKWQNSKRGCNAYGIDYSKKTISEASIFRSFKKRRCEFIVSRAEGLPFKLEFFDKVVCNCSLEHFKNDINVLREMNIVLKSKGLIALTVDSFTYHGISDNEREIHRKKYSVANYYNLEEIAKKMESAGFIIDQHKYYMNSTFSSFFVKHVIVRHKLPFALRIILSWFVFPICVVSDLLLSSKNEGYFLAVKGRKIRSLENSDI